MNRWRFVLMLCLALVTSGWTAPMAVTAQTGVTIYLVPVDARTGDSIFDACFVLQDFSNEGCDQNGDGRISYEGIPAGDYLVVQTVDADGYRTLDPVQITVRDSPAEQSFTIELEPIGNVLQPSNDDGEGVTIFFQTVDASDSSPITEACYVLLDASLEGCDTNDDGLIGFADVPPGVYTVQQTRGVTGYLPVGDFPILVNVHDAEQVWGVEMARRRFNVDSANISVVPFDVNTADRLAGACVILYGGSLEGCDENGDGQIDFDDVVTGSYLLSETVAPSGYVPTFDRWVHIQGDGQIFLEQWPIETENPVETEVDVALVTRHPETGELLTGACYIILDASIEGCDENGDGQVDFEGVSPGTYDVTQTRAPDGFGGIDDFRVQIANFDPAQSILIVQRDEQYAPGFRNVTVVLFDWDTGERLITEAGEACAVLVDYSNEGCDLNADGQIDFQDIPVGEYIVEVTGLPAGYDSYFEQDFLVVDAANPLSIVTIYVPVTTG